MPEDKTTTSGEIETPEADPQPALELHRQHPEAVKAALDRTADERQALSNAIGDPRRARIVDAEGNEEAVTIEDGPEPAVASGELAAAAGRDLELVRRGIMAIAGKVGLEESRLAGHHASAKMSIVDVVGIVRGIGDVARAVAGLVGGEDVEPVDPEAVRRRIDALEDELAKNNAAIDAAADAKFGPG